MEAGATVLEFPAAHRDELQALSDHLCRIAGSTSIGIEISPPKCVENVSWNRDRTFEALAT
jgi:hypothetical protein